MSQDWLIAAIRELGHEGMRLGVATRQDLRRRQRAGTGRCVTLDRLVRQIKTAEPKFDGVILTLQGAIVVESCAHGDAEVMRRVREAMGKQFPILVTHDFHVNVSPEIVRYSDALITYKEDPQALQVRNSYL